MDSVVGNEELLYKARVLIHLWELHDKMERDIIKLERSFTDDELDWLMGDNDVESVLYNHQPVVIEKQEEWHE